MINHLTNKQINKQSIQNNTTQKVAAEKDIESNIKQQISNGNNGGINNKGFCTSMH